MINWSLQVNKGIYHVSFRLTDKSGKRIQKQLSTGFKAIKGNKRKAEAKAQEIVDKWEGITAVTNNSLLCDYIADWVERDKARVQITTYDGYKHMLNKHIYPYFKNTRLNIQDVKPMHIEKYCTDKIDSGLKPNTVIKHFAIIRTAMQDAVKNGIIRINPADLAEKPKKAKPKNDFYNKDELQKLLAISKGTNIEVPIFLAIVYGLRRSEILGLTWSAIDFEKNTLTICNKVTRGMINGKMTDIASNTLKSDSSNRTFFMNEDVRNYLENVRNNQNQRPKRTNEYIDYVCVNEIGERIKADYITHKFKDLLTEYNMKKIRFHDLRHSCMSLLHANGFSIKQIQEYAGHADYTITANTYTHINIDDKQAEINSITNVLAI